MSSLGLLALALATVAASAAQPASAEPACAAQEAAAAPAIERANGDWLRAIKAGDADALAEAYAPDGVFVLPDGASVKGHDAVRRLYAFRPKPSAQIVGGGITSLGRTCGGEGLIYEWGRGELRTRSPDGTETSRGGPYLTVWKETDGGWKIIRNLAF